jgi:DNA-binding response OmpR family regulator
VRRRVRREAASGGSSAELAASAVAPEPVARRTVLVVGAGAAKAEALSRQLDASGFAVRTAASAEAAAAAVAAEAICAVVAVGPTVVRICLVLRQTTSAPILALLAGMAEADVLDAFAAGADDCQSAIIGEEEVALRLHALLRRAPGGGRR